MRSHLGSDALALIEGRLAAEARAGAEAHLEECAACAREVQLLRAAHTHIANSWSSSPELPDLVQKRLTTRLSAARPARRSAFFVRHRSAAAIVLIALGAGAGGFMLGRRSAAAPTAAADDRPLFALLLEEPAWPPAEPLSRPGYREWAMELAAARSSGGGHKLTDESGWRVHVDGNVSRPEAGPCTNNFSGWFLIRASNYDQAIDWVRRGPHLGYGPVLVRQVE